VKFKWLPKCAQHCRKHQEESPEIDLEFIERLMEFGSPSRYYGDRRFSYRYTFEAYFPPDHGGPYRVVFEVSDEQEIVPIACWRIKDKDFRKAR